MSNFWGSLHFVEYDGRLAGVYVFAWHGGTGEKVDQGEPTGWEFYVVPERRSCPSRSRSP